MTPLITTIVKGSPQILGAPAVIAVAIVAAAITAKPQPKTEVKSGRVDAHTMADIRIAPGSITWLR